MSNFEEFLNFVLCLDRKLIQVVSMFDRFNMDFGYFDYMMAYSYFSIFDILFFSAF